MPRNLSLLTFSNGPNPAHWALWLPATNTPTTGKIIHVTGNRAIGYFLQFKRNYTLETEDRTYRIILLAQIADRLVRDDKPGPETLDTTARDRLEGLALGVEPPGKSEKVFDVETRNSNNCQSWVRDFVERLIVEGYVGEEAREGLGRAPQWKVEGGEVGGA